jgi:hypothetical protein
MCLRNKKMIMVFFDSHAEIYTSQATKGAIINGEVRDRGEG